MRQVGPGSEEGKEMGWGKGVCGGWRQEWKEGAMEDREGVKEEVIPSQIPVCHHNLWLSLKIRPLSYIYAM